MKLLLIDSVEAVRKELYAGLSGSFPALEITLINSAKINKLSDDDTYRIAFVNPENAAVIIKILKKKLPLTKIYLLSAGKEKITRQDALKAGAAGNVFFPEGKNEIEEIIQSVYKEEESVYLKKGVVAKKENFGITGNTPAVQSINDFILKSAQASLPLLIEGESGTGKELVANAIHKSGPRAQKAFIAVNCGALPKDLLENELFGHESGAFTGATSVKRGLFEVADGGTLFIDEIGEMDPAAQVKLLRVLENGDYRRLGGTKEIKADVRVLAATNRVLEEEIEKGRFRTDLYYRLNALRVFLPPLRERSSDIPELIAHFLSRSDSGRKKNFSKEAVDLLVNYKWPGNIRELSNVVERAIVVSGNREIIGVKDLPDYINSYVSSAEETIPDCKEEMPLSVYLDMAEKTYLIKLLQTHGDNKAKMASVLKISRAKLYRKLNKYNLL
ncbi:MAG: sigma 54-interacting transcriptional regulator [Candidatus Goldbacteria bacterium]|nr:sigma 54-interacting transcriptional regulator [Candidatus Goldiibacteriota bacterium]